MRVVVHDGVFHADDALAVAILKKAGVVSEIVRSRKEDVIAAADIAVDVGGGEYDHHQPGGNGQRPNGIPYASAGLVWRDFGDSICGDSAVASLVDRQLMQPIDAADNGVDLAQSCHASGVVPLHISRVITWMNPVNGTPAEYQSAFMKAVEMMGGILDAAICSSKETIVAEREIADAIARWQTEGGPVILRRFVPGWRAALASTEATAVIYPSLNGGWQICAVPVEGNQMASRVLLPKEWRGLSGDALKAASGIPTAKFCHRAGFLAEFETLEDAVTAFGAMKPEN